MLKLVHVANKLRNKCYMFVWGCISLCCCDGGEYKLRSGRQAKGVKVSPPDPAPSSATTQTSTFNWGENNYTNHNINHREITQYLILYINTIWSLFRWQ